MQFLKLYLIIFIPKEDILFLLFHRLQNYTRPSLTSLKKKKKLRQFSEERTGYFWASVGKSPDSFLSISRDP